MTARRRVIFPFLLVILAFLFISARLFLLQVWFHDELNTRAHKLVSKETPEIPCRGTIYDRNGKILAMSVKTYLVFVDFKQVRDTETLKSALKEINVTLSARQISENAGNSYVPVADNIDAESVKKIKEHGLNCIGFTAKYQRKYPEDRMAAHLLGVVGKDGYGLEGVEYVANSYLIGAKVKGLQLRDGKGRTISEKLINPDEFRGSEVYLTIDRNIQFIAEQEIDRAWKESRAKKATVIVQDPNTGEIIAMASRPNFDPGDFSGSWENMRNPGISDIFEPGSTFKTVTSAAALSEDVVKRTEVIWCENGAYQVYDHKITDHEKQGLLTFDQVMQYSSNIGIAKVGQRLGKDKMYGYIKEFGFYSPTGIDLPGEAKGLLKTPGQWSGLSLPTISFGQEIGVTAMQVVNSYSAIANGGNLIEPRIINEIISPAGETQYRRERRIIRRAVSPSVAAEVRDILRGVIDKGTGQLAGVPGYAIGGKTGTAQKRDKRTGKYSSSCYVASFCGIAPLSNPKLTVFVMLDEPQGDYWAASRAAPVFGRIVSRTLQYLRIPPDAAGMRLAKNR